MYTAHDLREISDIIRSSIPGTREIILFGSHARGEASDESDADIAVIVERQIDRKEKLRALGNAWNTLGKRGFRVDIVIKEAGEFEADRDIPITLSHTIFHEGKSLWKARVESTELM